MDEALKRRRDAARRALAVRRRLVDLAESRLQAARRRAEELERKASAFAAMFDADNPLAGGALGLELARRLAGASEAARAAGLAVIHGEGALKAGRIERAKAERLHDRIEGDFSRAAEADRLADLLDLVAVGKPPAILPG